MLIDGRHNLLWPAMAIDGHRAQPIIGCRGQCMSTDILHNLMWPATAIEGHVSRSIVVDDVYRLTVSPVYCYDYCCQVSNSSGADNIYR